jgi:Ca2+-transporting ATPase
MPHRDADRSAEPLLWHLAEVEEVTHRLAASAAGLSDAEAQARRHQVGPNEISEGKQRGPLTIFLGQFGDLMIIVLIAAAVVSGALGDITDALVIFGIVLLNAFIGFVQEYRAERAVAALRRMAALKANVLRGGELRSLAAVELVPGDIVVLEAGNAVPADIRLLEAVRMRCEEATLSGESEPVEKHTGALQVADAPLGDRRNMAYKGTSVVAGRGRGVVVATGMDTELGKIAALLRAGTEVKTPLQNRLARFGRILAVAVLVICTILFVTGLLRGEPVLLMLLTAISLAVAAIPEALPAVVSIALALGARKMVLRNALVRKLPAVETLGSVTYICSDKTGTLTENRMRAEQLWVAGDYLRPTDLAGAAAIIDWTALPDDPRSLLVLAAALSNDVRIDANAAPRGDPTEIALVDLAHRAGGEKLALEAHWPRCGEIPFDSARSRMSTLHAAPAARVLFTKGAPEQVLAVCGPWPQVSDTVTLEREAVERAADRMAAEGLRVLAFAARAMPVLPSIGVSEAIERDLVFVGLVGLMDPPREKVREAVELCKSAGITAVMITGDHPATAHAIALRLGIITEPAEVITGPELARMDRAQFAEHVAHARVYARVAPEQKLTIVRALQDRGEFVAMTGDGVNDAPALRRADIGVAMGVTGSDVAKEAGHMILLDDNFATIVAAVREGRRIFDNIRKFIKYTMTSNSGEIWTIFLAPFLGLPIPLLPIHILWINLVTDGLPGLALAAEREERGIMQRAPRAPNESIFAHGMWQHILWVGLLMGAVSLFTQAWAIGTESGHWQTMVFTVLTFSQLGHALAIRSERDSLFAQGPCSNRALVVTLLATVVLQLATIYVPALNPIFRTEPLAATELVFCLLMSSIVFIAVEIEKVLVRRGRLYVAQRTVRA